MQKEELVLPPTPTLGSGMVEEEAELESKNSSLILAVFLTEFMH